jgi:hypothetical protein
VSVLWTRHGVGACDAHSSVVEQAKRDEDRPEPHHAGGRTAAGVIQQHGNCLRPDLSSHVGPIRTHASERGNEFDRQLYAVRYTMCRRQGCSLTPTSYVRVAPLHPWRRTPVSIRARPDPRHQSLVGQSVRGGALP